MRLSTLVVLAVVAVLPACQQGGTASLDTENQKASYAIGLDMGRNLKPAQGRLDVKAFMRGLEDAMADREPALGEEELQAALQAFGDSIRAAQEEERAASAEKNLEEGKAYLEENAAREGVVTTESGLQYEVLQEGEGDRPGPDDTVTIQYRGMLLDGTEFDSSYERGQPATFPVGQVIPGFSEALQLMREGSKFRVVIPAELAYGPQGAGGEIGPNATLIFEIELLEVKK
ncbi:MAG: FKBP-type peptidyl-prolyl cis-trans isomerase [Gemmatimonadota bacterium]